MKNFVDFARKTSLHGIKYTVLSTTSIVEKLFWILILVLSLMFSGYLTTLFWTRYTSNPTRTTLKTAFAPLTTVPFPGITICNRNTFLENKVNTFLTKLEASDDELLLTRNLFSYLINSNSSKTNELLYNVSELDIAQKVFDENDYADMSRIVKQVSLRCQDLIIRCAWNKKQVSCQDIFEESFTGYGRCCSFNYIREKSLQSPLYTSYYGLSTGLMLLLRPEHNKNVAGVAVIVHSPEDIPGVTRNLINYLGVGSVTYMQVDGSKRECSDEVKALPIGHRQCLYSDEKELNYFKNYMDSNCMSVCEAMSIYKICGCVPYYFEFIDDKPICDFRKLSCFQNIRINVSAESCGCLSQCDDEFYDVTMTSSKFVYNPNIWMMDFLEGFNDTESSILLNVFFATNRQRVWLRDAMTSRIYLVSSFGGIYSLFLGCSFITLIEILYYCFGKCFVQAISHKKNRMHLQKRIKPLQNSSIKYNIYIMSNDVRELQEYNRKPIMPYVN